jgi:hypothetical protein
MSSHISSNKVTPSALAHLEPLEKRSLMSVSGTSFVGPLKNGDKYTFDVYSGGSLVATDAEEVVTGASFDGNSATRIKGNFTAPGGSSISSTQNQYLTVTKDGITIFGIVESGDSGAETITTTYTPEYLQVPAIIHAGIYYRFEYTADEVTVINGGEPSSQSFTFVTHVKLESDTTVPVTTPAGTFNCYKMIIKSTDGSTTNVESYWFDPSIGLVKSVADSGGEELLTSYHL